VSRLADKLNDRGREIVHKILLDEGGGGGVYDISLWGDLFLYSGYC
jgi:hypothetical protein